MAQTSVEPRHSETAIAPTSAHPVVSYNPDAPSEEWGWHGSWRQFAPRGSNIILGIGVALMLLQNFTIHISNVEAFYYNGLALIGALYLVHRVRSGRKMRRAAEVKAASAGSEQ